jgi:hypothetical protein
MFDMLWHLRGSVPLRHATPGEAMYRLGTLLKSQRKQITARSSDQLHFDGHRGPDFFGNCRALANYERGHFWVEGGRVRYDLRSLHGFLFCTTAASLVALVVALFGAPRQGLIFGSIVWGWLYGMNVLIAAARVPLLFRHIVGGRQAAPPTY